jgi:heterodisulfide reductase subunit B
LPSYVCPANRKDIAECLRNLHDTEIVAYYEEEIKKDAGEEYNLPILYFTELMGLALGHKDAKKWLGHHITDPIKILRDKGLM